MSTRLFLALACVLIVLRLPSLVQPMGADQGLYSYVGERILDGGLPYRDAWDQKPPAIHYTYAGLRFLWPHDSVVPATELVVAIAMALLLVALGSAAGSRGAGQAAALLFLFLANPAFQRLGGVRIEAQTETFIALAVTAALTLLIGGPALWRTLLAGMCFGLAFSYKYNAAAYLAVGIFSLFLLNRLTIGQIAALVVGALMPPLMFFAVLWRGGAVHDLYAATIQYNLGYSRETYSGPIHLIRYLFTFPIAHARVDALWLVGGAGCILLLLAAFWKRERLLAPAWVAAACLVIAVNGSRGLPQYFVQAGPALALAAAWAGAMLWTRWRIVNVLALAVIAVGVWRVNNFQKLVENTWHDAKYIVRAIDKDQHLARYGEPNQQKYSALSVERLSDYLRTHSEPADRVYVFGFSPGAYVKADRVSASRFFWSRPVIAGFGEGKPGYGAAGVLADLQRKAPKLIALQQVDWLGDVDNSSHYFTTHPLLGPWLSANYIQTTGPEGFDMWMWRGVAP